MIDTHAHLSDPKFDNDRHQVIQKAFASGLENIIEIADKEDEWPKAMLLSEQHPGQVYWSAGCHPYYADQADASLCQRLRLILKHPACVAVGEIGLDYYKYNTVPRDTQKEAFKALVQAASQAKKPVIIHCRDSSPDTTDAQRDILKILDQRPKTEDQRPKANVNPIAGVMHCFQGTAEFAKACVDMGLYIGVDGPLTYPKAQVLRDVIKDVPLEKILLETDCPYLPPQIYRGKRNEPSYLIEIAKTLADLKGMPFGEISKATTNNAQNLFGFSAK